MSHATSHAPAPNAPFVPFILGSDIGAYSLARTFWETYGVRSVVVGRFASSPCAHSSIVDYRVDPNVTNAGVALSMVRAEAQRLAAETSAGRLVLLGCGDGYVRSIAEVKARLPRNVVTPCPDAPLLDKVINKANFYALCDKLGVAHPRTVVVSYPSRRAPELPFSYPVVLKAADSAAYFACSFAGQRKVYRIGTPRELEDVLDRVWAAGYRGDLVVQDTVPGADDAMRVITCYVDRAGTMAAACVGHVLLEEHTPLGCGNHAVIVTERNDALVAEAARICAAVGYTGLVNFDVKYDARDGSYRFFELNARQGRSNYYTAHAGVDLARRLVEDLVLEKTAPGGSPTTGRAGAVWSVVPAGIVRRYVPASDDRARVLASLRAGTAANPLCLHGDAAPARLARLLKHRLAQYRNYRTYLGGAR